MTRAFTDQRQQRQRGADRTLRFGQHGARTALTDGRGPALAVDRIASDTATYSLVDNAGGRFAIDGSKIVVARIALDYESATSHQRHRPGHRQCRQHLTRPSRSTSPTATRRRPTLRCRPTRWREQPPTGTVVGQLSAVDPDASDTATYSLVDNAGGRFAIDGSNIVVGGIARLRERNLASGHGAGHRQRRPHL